MLWLRKLGHEVLGIEISQKALDEFLSENQLNAEPVQHDNYCGYELEQMTLLCGDFFQLTAEDCMQVQAVYDRASIVALPPKMRHDYARHLQKVLPKGTPFLMVIMEYDQSTMNGPPFSVLESEVRELFAEFASIEVVDEERFERKGNAVTEKVLLLRP
jgi:thiopurine S-methyltransferase